MLWYWGNTSPGTLASPQEDFHLVCWNVNTAVVLLLEYRKSHNMFAGKTVNQEVVAGKKVEVKFSQEYSDGLHYSPFI